MDVLLEKATKAYAGPFGPNEREDAKHLIGRDVLVAKEERGLGSYAKLISIVDGDRPYFVEMDILGIQDDYGHRREYKVHGKFAWIVLYPIR